MTSISIAHDLPRAEVRRRMTARVADLPRLIPGGLAQVTHEWQGADRMLLTVRAMGQSVPAQVDVEDRALAISFDLPRGVGFLRPMIEGIIRQAGDKLLLDDKG